MFVKLIFRLYIKRRQSSPIIDGFYLGEFPYENKIPGPAYWTKNTLEIADGTVLPKMILHSFHKGGKEIIGNDLLGHYRVTLDYKNKKVYLKPTGTKPDTMDLKIGLYLGVDTVGHSLLTLFTEPNFPAYRAGLRQGDTVLQIADIDCRQISNEVFIKEIIPFVEAIKKKTSQGEKTPIPITFVSAKTKELKNVQFFFEDPFDAIKND